MGFFSDIFGLYRDFEEGFCKVCDFFRYDEGYIASFTRKVYKIVTFLPNAGGHLFNFGAGLAVNIPGVIIYGDDWETNKGNAKDYVEDKIYSVNKQLNDWGVNTRFAGEVINTAFIVAPSLKNGYKSTKELIYTEELFHESYLQVRKNQKIFERLEKKKQENFIAKLSEKQKTMFMDDLEEAYKRRKTENWNKSINNLKKDHPGTKTGVIVSNILEGFKDFASNIKSDFIEIFSEELAMQSRIDHEEYLKLKEMVRKYNQDMWILIDEEFNAIMTGKIDEYNKRYEGLNFDDHLKLGYEAIKTPAPLEDGLVGAAFQQLKGIAVNRNHYNLAIQDILKNEFH